MTDTIRDERQTMVTKKLETNNNRHPNVNVNLKKPTTMNPPPRDVKPDRLITNLSLSLSQLKFNPPAAGEEALFNGPKTRNQSRILCPPQRTRAHIHTQLIETPQNRSVRSQIEAHSQTLNPELQIPGSLY